MAEKSDKDRAATQRARYEFKRKLEELKDVRGRGTELVSVYVTPEKALLDVTQQLQSELAQAQNIKSKSTRKNVSSALETILGRIKQFKTTPERGLVFLAGHKAASGDQTEMVQFVIEPPEPVPINIYRCDSSFFLEPLEGMVAEKEGYALIVIDRSEATIGTLRGQRIEQLRHTESFVPRKHSKGGQSARRFERLYDEAVHNFFKHVGDMANEVLVGREGISGILVGGPGATKNEWVEGDYLHHDLKKKIIDTFDTGYTDEYGLRELVEAAHTTLEQRGLTREKDLLQRFLNEVRQDHGLFSYGEKEVREFLQMGAVEILILSETLRRWRVSLSCNQCDHTWEVTTTEEPDDFQDDLPTCPSCEAAQGQFEEATDVVEELTQMADSMGTTVEIVSDQSEEGKMLKTAFGGIAAILRYRPR